MTECTGFSVTFKLYLAVKAAQLALVPTATMAVHLRLTDKVHDEAKENAMMSNEMVVIHVRPRESSRRLIAGDYIRW